MSVIKGQHYVSYKDEVRLVSLHIETEIGGRSALLTLRRRLSEMFQIPASPGISLEYQDSLGNNVLLESEEDLEDALLEMRVISKPLTLTLRDIGPENELFDEDEGSPLVRSVHSGDGDAEMANLSRGSKSSKQFRESASKRALWPVCAIGAFVVIGVLCIAVNYELQPIAHLLYKTETVSESQNPGTFPGWRGLEFSENLQESLEVSQSLKRLTNAFSIVPSSKASKGAPNSHGNSQKLQTREIPGIFPGIPGIISGNSTDDSLVPTRYPTFNTQGYNKPESVSSKLPTRFPTFGPSKLDSDGQLDTTIPTRFPTFGPSKLDSDGQLDTTIPTRFPTFGPSKLDSDGQLDTTIPTRFPTFGPSRVDSNGNTDATVPTRFPTFGPSKTSSYIKVDTTVPTRYPTLAPSQY